MALPGITRWENRVALVTGAGTGIGAAVSKQLVKYGMIVLGCARNIEPINALSAECTKLNYKGKLHSYKCDLTKENEIEEMFNWIKSNLGGVDVCINNAGFTYMTPLLELNATQMREMLDTNIVALVLCSKLSVASMLERGVNDGHIININSVLGHVVWGYMNFYAGTKFAVKAITEGLRKELDGKGTRIRVSQLSPGRVETRFLHRATGDFEKSDAVYSSSQSLTPDDVANTLLHILSAPEYVQVQDVIMQPLIPTTASLLNMNK